ncbi:Cytochrome P450 E-class group I protein [Dioscorea alata]|uniref:Cytochrome P450 E-class group I protein n=1 Tax=Dioscorea alata TaxID=55571 RepID=A0ACB7W2T0_DIOAL|nr:Cytochrome P450 E-class group I protein [Dioscorea alata]
MDAWFWWETMLALALRYPEILLAIACFFFVSQMKKPSRTPVNWPVVGMIPYLFTNTRNFHDWLTDVLRASNCTFVFKGPVGVTGDLLLTCDPANVNHVFNVNFTNYPKGGGFSEIFDVLGNGIFNADHDSWKYQRKKAHALISDKRFRSFVGITSHNKVKNGLIPTLNHLAEGGHDLDLQDVFMRLTFDITCNLIFGIDPGCLAIGFPTVPFAKALDDAEESLFFRHVTPRKWKWIRYEKEKKLESAWKTIDHFIAQYVSLRKHDMMKKTINNNNVDAATNLLSSYLNCELEAGELGFKFDTFLRDTTLNLMVAGRDTTSSGLTWFFWLVAKNPKVEAKIIEELQLKLYHYENSNDTSSLIYLHAALLESLRLYPPVPFEHKGVVRPDILPSGHGVRRRRMLVFSLYAMGRMESIWGKDCMEYRPERWISESGKIKHEPSYKYLVFNCGPRTCLGKDMAFTQMKATAAAIISNFHVEILKGHVARPKLSIILHMKDGLMVRLRKRG